jgi:hypothetical protein
MSDRAPAANTAQTVAAHRYLSGQADLRLCRGDSAGRGVGVRADPAG